MCERVIELVAVIVEVYEVKVCQDRKKKCLYSQEIVVDVWIAMVQRQALYIQEESNRNPIWYSDI